MGTTVPPLNDMKIDRRTAIKTAAVGVGSLAITPEFLRAKDGAELFGEGFANLEMLTTGEWWKRPGNNGKPAPKGRKGAPPSMNVPRYVHARRCALAPFRSRFAVVARPLPPLTGGKHFEVGKPFPEQFGSILGTKEFRRDCQTPDSHGSGLDCGTTIDFHVI